MDNGPLVWDSGFEIRLTEGQQKKVDGLLIEFKSKQFAPPTTKTIVERIGDDLFQAMLDMGLIKAISSEVVVLHETYQQAVDDVKGLIIKNGSVSLAQARDHWSTTRRYAQALLEYMDQKGITKRDGDVRILR
jgi:selenocysteine-specific elongation factor